MSGGLVSIDMMMTLADFQKLDWDKLPEEVREGIFCHDDDLGQVGNHVYCEPEAEGAIAQFLWSHSKGYNYPLSKVDETLFFITYPQYRKAGEE